MAEARSADHLVRRRPPVASGTDIVTRFSGEDISVNMLLKQYSENHTQHLRELHRDMALQTPTTREVIPCAALTTITRYPAMTRNAPGEETLCVHVYATVESNGTEQKTTK